MSIADLLERYRQGWAQTYGMPCSVIHSPLDFGKLQIHLETLTELQIEEALAGYFASDDPFLARRRHPLGLFLANPMRYMPARQPSRLCPHEPICQSFTACRDLLLEAGRVGKRAKL